MVPRFRRFTGFVLFFAILLAGVRAAQDFSAPYYFTSIAGISSVDLNKENTTAASLNRPQAVASAADGTLYVADNGDFTIHRITPAGVSSVFAGSPGNSGSADGTGTAARFRNPQDIALDSSGNVYVSDASDHTIRKITSAGVVTTLAGTAGSSGSADGTGAAARFNTPWGLTVGPTGDIFVADLTNCTIRKITPAGVVTTFAGQAGARGFADGAAVAARFASPRHLAVDSAGTLFLTDSSNTTVRKISATGEVSTLAGSPGVSGRADGVGAGARFETALNGITLDRNGNLFVSETERLVLRKITPAGEVTTPSLMFPPGSNFLYPHGLSADTSGNIYVADSIAKVVFRISPNGVATIAAGGSGLLDANGYVDGIGRAARFRDPAGIAVDAGGTVYVADTGNQVVRKITADGGVTTFAGSVAATGAADGVGGNARFKNPSDLAIDGAGNLYAADEGNGSIRKITPAGSVSTLAANAGEYLGIDGAGTLYATNVDRILKVSATGGVSPFIQPPLFLQAPGLTLNFTNPADVAVDSAGNVFAADPEQRIIWKITPAGSLSIFAGQPFSGGFTDGTGSQANFMWPTSLAIDPAGNLYVVDTDAIRKITPTGIVSTIAGGGIASVVAVSNRDDVTLFGPHGIAVDVMGAVYITDGPVIRKGIRAGAPAITAQPQSLRVTAGDSVQFSVTVTGTGLSYQWYFNGGVFSGATGNTLSFGNARATDAGDYTVVVVNASGSVTSNKATLTVSAASSGTGSSGGSGSGSSGGGGGGAPSWWFITALLFLAIVRRGSKRS